MEIKMADLNKTLNQIIDEYCLDHAIKYNLNISAIYDAKIYALECDDHLKTELNHKILTDLMGNYTHRQLFSALQERGYVIHK